MQQLTYIKTGVLEWRDVPEPTLQSPKEAIVRPFVAARCDGDLVPLFNDVTGPMTHGLIAGTIDPVVADFVGERPFQGPFAFGHECVAEVLECGDDVTTVKKGDKVIVPWAISCGTCFNCHHGLTSKCDNRGETLIAAYGFGPASGDWGGAISDKLRVPYADGMLVPLPSDIDPLAVASGGDNLPDGWRCVAPILKQYPGAPVLVVGGAAFSIGLYAVGIAVALGSTRVDYFDYSHARLKIAESLGANPVEVTRDPKWYEQHAPRRGGPYYASVDASNTDEGLDFALRSLAPGGVCTGVSYYFRRKTPVPMMHMYLNSSTLRVSISQPRTDVANVFGLIRSGKFKPQLVTTLVAPWEDAARAFLERTTKVIVKRDTLI